MTADKQAQLEKLARTLVRSGITSSFDDALQRAREMLKIPAPAPEKVAEAPVDPKSLPKVDDIASLGVDLDREKTLKEIMEEDAKKIYEGGQPSNG